MIKLYPHPTTACQAVDTLQVTVSQQAGDLHLHYVLQGDLQVLLIPSPQPAAAVDGLWQHTCLEAFIGVQGDSTYHEFNFSPSSQWAAYAFSAYRERVDWQASQAPPIRIGQTVTSLSVDVVVAAADLPANPLGLPWQLGLTAVVEAVDGSKSYWALHHPADRPDFHHRAGFVYGLVC